MAHSQKGEAAAETAAVALGSRVLAAAGQGDMVWGHLAVRDPEGRGCG